MATTERTAPLLSTISVRKSFGGLVALDGVSFDVYPGEIKGIIGPNGAGKTTLYNLISGIYAPDDGELRFDGQRIGGKRPSEIAALGITRTFQNVRLFDNMTVLENVMVARHVRTRSGFWAAAFRLPAARREEAATRASAEVLLKLVGLTHRTNDPATDLPFGRQRTLEIARALATEPLLLMLDEPAAGLNQHEREELLELVQQIRDRGVTILLVEHDVDLVMRLVDSVMVLDYGRVIADGSPSEVQGDRRVIAAYLGEDEE